MRILVLLSLIAAAGTLMAAPPRFNKPGSLELVEPESRQDEPAARGESTTSETGGETGKATATSADTAAQKPAKEPTQTASVPQQATSKPEAKKSERKSRWFWPFGKKNNIPVEKTEKPEGELINSFEHHESETELLGTADVHRYSSGLKEFWKVETSKNMCVMKQSIPNYGYVEFRQGVGQPLEFALFVGNPPAGVGKAYIRSEPPEWRHFGRARDLGVIEVEPGKRAVTAPANWSRRLFMEMSEGMQPVLRYSDAADASDDMEVLLSALNFQQSLDLFSRCLGQLLRYDYKSTKRTIVYFHEDSSRLRSKAKKQLDEVLEILKADPGIKQVDLELYTHRQGLVRYNFRLATRRARAVRDYLIQRGIEEDKLLIKIHTKRNSVLKKLGYKPTDVHVILQRKVAK